MPGNRRNIVSLLVGGPCHPSPARYRGGCQGEAKQNHRIDNMTTTAAPMGQDSARAILGDGSNQ